MIILITAQHFSANRVPQKQKVFCVIDGIAQVIQVNSVPFSALIFLKVPLWYLQNITLQKYSIQTPYHPSSNAASPFPRLAAVQVQLSCCGPLGCSHTHWQHTSPQPHNPAHQHTPGGCSGRAARPWWDALTPPAFQLTQEGFNSTQCLSAASRPWMS